MELDQLSEQALADSIERYATEAYQRISEEAHYDFELTPEVFNHYLDIHLSAVTPLIEVAKSIVMSGTESQIQLFGDVLVKLCMREGMARGEEPVLSRCMHSLAPIFLLNALGVTCVKYQRFKELDSILGMSVPAGNFLYPEQEAFLLPMLESFNMILGNDPVKWRYSTGRGGYYGVSRFLKKLLDPFLLGCFTDDLECESTFYIWEHLKSLTYVYCKCCDHASYVPLGSFLPKRTEYRNRSEEGERVPYIQFFEEADTLEDDWEPIKQGMFGGSYTKYKRTYDQAEEYYNQYGILAY